MLKKILTIVVPLIAPAVIYLVWAYFAARRRRAPAPSRVAPGRSALPVPVPVPWLWLAVAGLVLMAASLAATALTTGDKPGRTYVPARIEGDRIVPARTE